MAQISENGVGRQQGFSSHELLKTAGAILFVVFAIAAGIWMRRGPAPPTESDIPVIMKEAAGAAPIPAKDTPARKAIRDSFRYLLDEDKAYNDDLEARLGTPAMTGLLQPASFTQAGSMEVLITELRAVKDVEAAHLRAVQRFPEVAKENLQKAGLRDADVQAFERGMTSGMSKGIDLLAEAVAAEAEWIDAVIALYQFALDNVASIRVNDNGQLEFDDEVTQTEFDRLAARVDELGQASEEANAALDATQQNAQRKIGITRRDVPR